MRLPPFQPTIIFHDGIFGRFTKFFLQKHQNLGIHYQKTFSFWGTSPDPYRGFAPGPHGGLPSPRGPPPFAHSKYATARSSQSPPIKSELLLIIEAFGAFDSSIQLFRSFNSIYQQNTFSRRKKRKQVNGWISLPRQWISLIRQWIS